MLSEDEIKAIERLEEQLNFWKKQNIKNSDCEIILNLITKLQKENEHWKNGFERELQDNRENTCELLKQDLIIREKDKQINLMADKLVEAHEWFYSEFDNFTKEDFIEYFETKAKKGE